MYLLPAYLVAIAEILAGFGWIVFARSQAGRFQSRVLPWLSIPYFAVAFVYLYFNFYDVDIEIRAAFARHGYLVTSLPQAIVLIALYFLNRGAYGKP